MLETSRLQRPRRVGRVDLRPGRDRPSAASTQADLPAPLWSTLREDLFVDVDGLIEGRVRLKLEGCNPAGSIKLKTALSLVAWADEERLIGPDTVLVESSSGNLGLALAMVAAQRGRAFTCVVDPNAQAASLAMMAAFGARVVTVTERDANGGFLASRIDTVRRLVRDDPRHVWLNQYANPANPAVHERITGPALLAGAPDATHVFVGAGTTGTLMGCARFFRRARPGVKIVAVDSVGSVTFGAPPGPRRIPGLGTSRKPEICFASLVDDVIFVPEADAIRMCRRVARAHGLLLGGSTGTVLAGIAAAAGAGRLRAGAVVAAISPDNGDRYLDTIYDDAWVHRHFPDALSPRAEETPSC